MRAEAEYKEERRLDAEGGGGTAGAGSRGEGIVGIADPAFAAAGPVVAAHETAAVAAAAPEDVLFSLGDGV